MSFQRRSYLTSIVSFQEYAFMPQNVSTENEQPFKRRTSPRVKVEASDNSYGESFVNGSVTSNCNNVYIKGKLQKCSRFNVLVCIYHVNPG